MIAEHELADYLDCEEGGGQDGLRIADDGDADRFARRIARFEREQEEREEVAVREIAKIRTWVEDGRERTGQATLWLRSQLEEYARRLLDADPRHKTHVLPSATLQLRMPQPAWSWPEQESEQNALLEYARAHDLVRVREEVRRDELMRIATVTPDGRAVDENGELIPGVRVEPAHQPKFTIVLK